MKNFLFFLLSFQVFFGLYDLSAQDITQNQMVSGIVLNQVNGQPIIGASISVPGFSSAMTNDSGRFAIKIPKTYATLVITGPGYAPREISIKNRTDLRIVMYKEGYKTTYDNIVMPFDDVLKSKLTYSVSSVKEDNILSSAVGPEGLLQSNTTGLYTIFRSGMPGDGVNMYLQIV